MTAANIGDVILKVRDLKVDFELEDETVHAVKGISFDLRKGETLALVGESGSGKSVTSMAIMQLHDPKIARYPEGSSIEFEGTELINAPRKVVNKFNGDRIAMIFQEPMSSLNPYLNIETQLAEVLIHHGNYNKDTARKRILELFELVELPNPKTALKRYPHEFSGGQLQRIMIAMALGNEPDLLIADEPTTALDVTIQAQVLELLASIQKRMGMAILFVTHDLGVVKHLTDNVCVMRFGEIVETGKTTEVFANPKHEYTQHLLDSTPKGRKTPVADEAPVILDVDKVLVQYPTRHNFFGKPVEFFDAVKQVSLTVREGQTVGIVGESGSGKSTLGRAILKLLDTSAGTVEFNKQRIDNAEPAAMRPLRKTLQVVFQDPYGSLSPRMTVGDIVAEGLRVHYPEMSKDERQQRVEQALEAVRMPKNIINRYPHEFSGGQRQRIAIARAVVLEPKLVMLDEPTSALDRSVQVTVVELLRDLQKRLGMSYVFISHDLSVVRAMSDYVLVMRKGEVVEQGPTEQIFDNPQTQYCQELINAAYDL
ncbi:ABC transporter ATP-binding protein [Salinibius halmophilus]|uniref:ABC transporter ATP-binding protein n=1 Tax=Salinibius halmophilus TaxID=1853216 RepID=UPI001F2F4E15|nr:ABC transporter ATP-binding protein [Salinibius halmophilus]